MAQLKPAPAEGATCAELARYAAYLRAELLFEIDTREAQIARLKAQMGGGE